MNSVIVLSLLASAVVGFLLARCQQLTNERNLLRAQLAAISNASSRGHDPPVDSQRCQTVCDVECSRYDDCDGREPAAWVCLNLYQLLGTDSGPRPMFETCYESMRSMLPPASTLLFTSKIHAHSRSCGEYLAVASVVSQLQSQWRSKLQWNLWTPRPGSASSSEPWDVA